MKYLIVLFALVLSGCATETPREKMARETTDQRRALCALHGLTYVSEYHEKIRWPSRNHRVVYGAVCTDDVGNQSVIKDNGKPYGC
jgi:hypothetical protein